MKTLCFQTNISNLISNDFHLTMLENQCSTVQDLKKIHAHFIKTGLSKQQKAISRVLAFSATADINYAYSIFTHIQHPNLFMWNTIIRGFSQSSTPQYAILLFIHMLTNSTIEPQRLTYPSLFKAYTQLGLPLYGAQLHGRIIKLGLEFDPFIRNTIIHMYANLGCLFDAFKLFDEEEGDFDVVACNSLIMGLAKNRQIDEAKRLFDAIGSRRNAISFNTMISGYVRNEKIVEAMELFRRMQAEGIKATEFTMVSLLNACANIGSLEQGEWIYHYICKNGFQLNVIMVTAIVDMYCKCGAINKACQIFETASIKGLSSWNSLILGLANNGCEEEALELFSELLSSNIQPNDVTFLGALTACAYKGKVDQAKEYFLLMLEQYKIKPSIKHYNCIVDVLGQAGLLNEAEQLIQEMPLESDVIIWGSLLSSCRKHGNIDMAIRSGKQISEIDSNESASYILMSNVFAASGQFENAIKQRAMMKKNRVSKEKGCSSIEINGVVQLFGSGGKLHSEIQDHMFLINSYSKDEMMEEVDYI